MGTTRSNYKLLLQIIAAQAQHTPAAIAAIHGEEVMTYRELNHRANQLAHWLRAEGVEAGVRVGLCLEHGLDLMVAVLGILKSGGICVPLEPDDPALRLVWLLSDTQPLLTVTQQTLLEHLPTACESIRLDGDSALLNRQPTHEPTYPFDSPDLAFIFYTSGTTGQPKGVMHSHNELLTAYTWLEGYYEITPQDCGILRIASHLVGFRGEILSMLVSGAKTIVADHRRRNDVEHLLDLILRHGISFIRLTPTMLKGLLDSPRIDQCRSLRHVVCSGEPLPQDLEERFLSRLPAVKLHLFYGATEAPGAMCRICQPGDRQASNRIGRPVAKSYVRLLSPDLQPVAQGAEGEICIGGAVVSQGYWNRPDLTAARFIPDPLGANPNNRLYRTGDRGRELDDGQIVYLGRSDRQANLRGLRIDLNEIEHSLRSHPHVSSAAVLVREERPGEQRLIAYLTPTSTDRPPMASALRAFLAERLPVAMIPERFIVLSQFPVGRSGKVDYAALSVPGVEPSHPHEDTPRRHAGQDDVTNDESIVELMARLRRLGVVLSVTGKRLKCQAPEGILTETLLEGIKARKADLIDFIRWHVSDDSGGDVPLVAIARTEPLPLSHAQQQLWFLAQLEPGNPFYHGDLILELDGPLDRAALQVALQQLIERHEPLRTRFVQSDGHLCQGIQAAQPIECPFWVLQEQTPKHQAEAIRSRLDNLFELPFDLEQGPPLRLGLLQLDARRHLLILILHHIVFDGWSLAILQRDLAALYRAARTGEAAHLPTLTIQYADFAHWQRRQLQGARLDRLVAYWRERLSDLPDGLSLPTDHPRPPRPGYRGGRHRLYLDAALTRTIDALARTTGTTRFMLLLTAFQVWLMRCSGEADITVATPVANRRWRALEDLIGCFVNTLILRTDLGAVECFPDALKRVRMEVLSAFEHQDLPFDVLVERLNPVRHQDRHPLTQIVFAVQNTPQPVADWGELSARPWPQAFETVRFDLEVHVWPDGEGLDCDWLYSRDLWEPESIARMAGHFQTLLAGLLAEPDRAITEIPMLSKEDERLLWAWNQTETPYPEDRTLVDLFEQQVERTPDSIALVFDEQSLSYAELNGRANRLAHHLITLGLRPETLVGICVERSLEMVIGLLAILKAGGAYLPLDPEYPRARMVFMLEDAGASLVLSTRRLAARVPEFAGEILWLDESAPPGGMASENPGVAVAPEHLAYVNYTSGSTGRPKGVEIIHRAVLRLVCNADYCRFGSDRVFLQFAPVSFDAATFEIWGALLHGARLILAPPGRHALDHISTLIHRHRITTLFLTTALFNQLVVEDIPALAPVEELLMGGETNSREHVERALQELSDTTLIHVYGPTETTTFATSFQVPRVPGSATIPIGRPIANTRIYILDKHLHPQPIGLSGELCIAGRGLARGYLNRPELTAERFIELELFGRHERIYRTGDLARWRPDGNLEFLGRLDHQIKIRGFRIEPGEIEAALAAQPGIKEAVVLAREDGTGDKRLVAYLVLGQDGTPDAALDTAALRRALAERLPEYMLPSVFVPLDAFPLTANGKLDRTALPVPELDRSGLEVAYVAPRTPTEQALAELWQELLMLSEPPGIHDDFFALGGHSLLATQVVSRLDILFEHEVSLRAFFAAPTIAELAAEIEQRQFATPASELPPLHPHEGTNVEPPLSFAQQRFWLLARTDATGTTYQIPVAYRLCGPLDVPSLQAAFRALVVRHQGLRLIFPEREGLPQVQERPNPQPLEILDLQHLPPAERELEIQRRIHANAATALDLAKGPLLRASLLQVGDAEAVLLINLHHIIADGWSLNIFLQELGVFYRVARHGQPAPLPLLPIKYTDYAHWQRQWLETPRFKQQLQDWCVRLVEAPMETRLPADDSPPADQAPVGAYCDLQLDHPLSREVEALCRTTASTPFMLLLAIFAELLSRYAGQRDLVIGTPIAGRRHPATEGLIGLFLNTLALRLSLAGQPNLLELLAQAKEVALWAFDRQDVPFEHVLGSRQRPKVLGQTPLFQTQLVVQNMPDVGIELEELEIERLHTPFVAGPKVDLNFHWYQHDGRFHGRLYFDSTRHQPSSIERFLRHFERLLRVALAQPQAALYSLSVLADPAIRTLPGADRSLVDRLLPIATFTAHSVAAQFTQIAAWYSARPALLTHAGVLTYAELHAQATALAWRLHDAAPAPLGLLFVPGAPMLIALCAAVLAGRLYVVLDVRNPPLRNATILADSGAVLLLTTPEQESEAQRALEAGCAHAQTHRPIELMILDPQAAPAVAPTAPLPAVSGETLAYILYTSGSTGRPKGVAQSQQNVLRHVEAYSRALGIMPKDRLILLAPLSADAAVQDIFGALLNGAGLALPDPRNEPLERLTEWIEQHQISLLHLTPTLLRYWSATWPATKCLETVRALILGGEPALRRDLVIFQKYFSAEAVFVNGYGLTECTVALQAFATRATPLPPQRVPIGHPVPGIAVQLLDADGQPTDLFGEIALLGMPLALGYWQQPEKTAAVFETLADGRRRYRTGDLGRRLSDGRIECVGRRDHQIKLRGFRIEPGEIESALMAQPGIREAVVLARENSLGETRLVAYLVLGPQAPEDDHFDASVLRRALAEQLPDYMLPAAFVRLDVLPLTPSGKLDRQALPAPSAPEPVSSSATPTGAPNPLEQRLLGIWQRVLGLSAPPGLHDDFFDLGGHSLLAAGLVHAIETELQVRLPLAALFRFSTVVRLAESLSDQVTLSSELGSTAPSTAPDLGETLYRILLSFHIGRREARLAPDSLLMRLNPDAVGVPLYYCGELGTLAAALPERPIIAMDSGFGAMAVTAANVQALAGHYVRELLDRRLPGPFVLLGHSLGAWVAFEMAQRLLAHGQAVPLLGLIDRPVDQPYAGRVAQFIADRGPCWERCSTDAWRQTCSQHFPAGMSLDYVLGDHVSILRQGASAQLLAERIEARLAQTARSIRPLAEDARRPCWQAPDELGWAMDECATVTLSLTNVGMSVWGDEYDLAVGYHWYDDHQRLVEWAAGIQSLALPLSPGQTASLLYDIAAPGGPGRYRLVFDLLDRAGTWGSLSQSGSLAVAVEIQPPRVGSGDVESARRAWSAGRDLETIRACERLLASRDSAPLWVFQQLVQALQHWGRPERALEQVRRGLERFPKAAQLHRLHTELALALGPPDRALEAARRLLEIPPERPMHWALLAQAHTQLGDHPAAIEAYRQAMSQRSEFDWHKALAICLEQDGQFAAAAAEWRRAVALKPGLLPLSIRLAQVLRKSQQPQAALEVCRHLLKQDPEHLEGHRLAMELLRELDHADAEITDRQVLVLNSENVAAINNFEKMESKKVKLILHIGTEKTGTTTLQAFLEVNREALARQGFVYLKTPGLSNSRKLVMCCMDDDQVDEEIELAGIIDPDVRERWRKDFLRDLKEECSTLNPGQTAIISSEHFHSRLTTESGIERLHRLLSDMGFMPQIVVYLRRQDELAASLYNTLIRNGYSQSKIFPETTNLDPYFNYESLLNKWSSVFGKENLFPFIYKKNCIYHGGIVSNFSSFVKIDITEMTVLLNQNVRMSACALEVLRTFNCLVPLEQSSRFINDVRGRLYQGLSNAFPGEARLPVYNEAVSFYRMFDTSNQVVSKEWFDGDQLFDDDFSKYPESEISCEDFDPNLLLKIIKPVVDLLNDYVMLPRPDRNNLQGITQQSDSELLERYADICADQDEMVAAIFRRSAYLHRSIVPDSETVIQHAPIVKSGPNSVRMAIGIRTHNTSLKTLDFAEKSDFGEGFDVYWLADETAGTLDLPKYPKLSHRLTDFKKMGLPTTGHNGLWYHGDYAYYAFARAAPGYDYYLILEYDVLVKSGFFQKLVSALLESPVDLASCQFSIRPPEWYWWETAHADFSTVYGVLPPVILLSSQAINHLLNARLRAASHLAAGKPGIYFEGFIPSELMRANLSCMDLNHLVPNVWAAETCTSWKPILVEEASKLLGENWMMHPVLDESKYVAKAVQALKHEPKAGSILLPMTRSFFGTFLSDNLSKKISDSMRLLPD